MRLWRPVFGTYTLGADNSGIYWVSPTGTASWADCESASPLSGAAACAMATANDNATAGATINLRAGTYNTNIQPANSGALANRITYQGHTGETAIITNVGNTPGIHLNGVDYIRVLRVTVSSVFRLGEITNGSSFNEVAFSTLTTGNGTANTGFNVFSLSANAAMANTHNWIHHNVINGGGSVNPVTCEDAGGLINIGSDLDLDGFSNYNTFEDNVIYWGAHHAFKVNTRYNVVRNNFIHNEAHFPASAACKVKACAPDNMYGNRVLTVLNNHVGTAWFSDTYNLIENNRIGSAGLASDGNGSDGLTLGGERDIARFNTIYNAQELGIYFRSAGNIADNNRAYNNTVAYNGQGPQCRVDASAGFWKGGVRLPGGADDNVVKNNLLYGNYEAGGRELHNVGSGNAVASNWLADDGNPLFVNTNLTNLTSATVPDLSLQAGSPAIDKGVALTLANGGGSVTTKLVVDDALYFQDGARGSVLASTQADWIAIGTVGNTVKIASIDYKTNTITLTSAKSWGDNAPIWLSRDSDGTIVLKGNAPDQGAFESSGSSTSAKPQAPKNLKIAP